MSSLDLATGYVPDWEAFDFVESAEYTDPPGVGEGRENVEVKAKLDDTNHTVSGGQIEFDDATTTCIVWPTSDTALKLRVGGQLRLAESGVYVITAATKTRFGVWTVNVEPFREDGNPDA